MIRAGLLVAATIAGLSCAAVAGSAWLTEDCADLAAGGETWDLAVVLSASVRHDGTPGRLSAERTRAAAALHAAGVVERLHFTGNAAWGQTGPTAAAMARLATDLGVPAEAITTETRSESTLQNALFSLPQTTAAESLLLVSTGMHLWRGAASMAWAGTPVDAMCRTTPFDARGDLPEALRRAAQEAIRWPVNIARAGLWSAAEALGVEDSLPDWWLE